MPRKVTTLKNGLRVVHIPFENIQTATFRLYGRAGSLWEENISLGAAHFLEHLVFEGTTKYPKSEKLRRLVSDVGGTFNAFTSFDKVGFVAKTLDSDIDKALEFLSQLVTEPLLKKEEIQKHRSIITQELQRKLDNPVTRFLLNSEKIIFPEDYRRTIPVLGTYKSIASMNKEILKNYLNQNYTANNFVLGICSNIETSKLFKKVEKHFKSMRSGEKNRYPSFKPSKTLKYYSENNTEIKQSTVTVDFFAPDKDNELKYATDFLTSILGGSNLSRIVTEIRERRGLAYVSGANYVNSKDYGMISIYAQIDQNNYQKVLGIIKKEIEKMRDNSVKKHEYERTRKGVLANFIFNNESPKKRANFYTNLVLDDYENEDYDSILEKYKKVTIEDIQKVANKIFSGKPKIGVLSKNLKLKDIQENW